MIELRIPLPPTPWSAPRISRYGAYDIKEKDKRAVRYLIAEQYQSALLTSHTALKFLFEFKPPVSVSKTKRAAMLAGEYLPVPDCTNLQKLYEDCLQGIVIDDDRKVAEISSKKLYAEKDCVTIKVYTLEEYKNENSNRTN